MKKTQQKIEALEAYLEARHADWLETCPTYEITPGGLPACYFKVTSTDDRPVIFTGEWIVLLEDEIATNHCLPADFNPYAEIDQNFFEYAGANYLIVLAAE